MSKPVTLADVAQRAGVSKTAASLALNESPASRLSSGTVQRVRDAAEELGYRPNPAARSLRLGTTRTVAVVSDDVIITRYASAMITGALDVAHATDHTLLISEANGDPDRMAEAVQATLDGRAVGVIFALETARLVDLPPLPDRLKVVLLNATGSRGEPAVLPAEYEAGFGVANELLQAGHREIAIIGHPPDDRLRALHSVTVGTRLNGIRAAFQQASLTPALRLDATRWEPEVGFTLARQVLLGSRRVTALLCMNDRLAFGAYQALQESGVQIPGEMSLASFDDDEIAQYLRPGLTTAGIPYREMGRRAMTMLLDGEVPEAPVQLPHADSSARFGRATPPLTVEVVTALLVGHGPGLPDLAARLHRGSGDAPLADFRTSAVAVFAVEGSWDALDPGTATLSAFTVPRG